MSTISRTFSSIMEMRVLAGLICLLIAALVMPIKELRWTLWATPTNATLLSIHPESRGQEISPSNKRVTYEFDDNGTLRSESDLVTTNWPIPHFNKSGLAPPNATIEIEYLPNSTSSRLKGHDDKAWYWTSGIVAILATLVAACWWKFRDAT